jgi:two-component system sensor histidine kinase GlrK
MRDLLESVIADHRHRLEAKALAVKELVQPVRFNGVPEHLRMIVDNLISNAVKFSPVGGEIRVMVRAAGDTLELEVEDNGPGIDPAEGQRVFEPFFRGRAALANGSEGAGLGLAIVTECVAGLHGKVELIEPRQDETGARIRVELPMQGQAG